MTAYTALGIPYPNSTDPPQGPAQMQALAEKVNELLTLPATVTGSLAVVISPTNTSWGALPSAVNATMANPSPDLQLEIDVEFKAWVNSGTRSTLQVGIAATGGLAFAPNSFGSGGAVANGDNIITTGGVTVQGTSSITVIIPAGSSVTFSMQSIQSGGTATTLPSVNYPVIRLKPRRFIA